MQEQKETEPRLGTRWTHPGEKLLAAEIHGPGQRQGCRQAHLQLTWSPGAHGQGVWVEAPSEAGQCN